MFIDNQQQVLKFKALVFGTIDAAAVYPRIVVEQALKHRAATVILTHNLHHELLSIADKQITTRLEQALDLIDVRVLDHMIVADPRCYSFAEHGYLSAMSK
ncbi:JAB domain-containing protein [Colwellia sp. TT2012]|uniref:JAB domain-containing protein n=1 Tax=Colwellia sp. TT2012 TaxID=1720342 RepID=UPI00070B36D7|nr:JAB domain-containing protein [Colwellia sp. TT2012]